MERKKANDLKKISEDLEKMIMSTESSGAKEISKDGTVLPQRVTSAPMNYDALKAKSEEHAEEIVNSIVLLYLPTKFISEHEYVSQKMSIDKLTIADLLFQMTTSAHAIKKLLEDIDSGNMQPRAFEVLAGLQKSKMEIVKHLASFMVIMENNYKSLKIDYNSSETEKPAAQLNSGDSFEEISEDAVFKARGTKDLINIIRGATMNEEKPDAD
jgi:hypothetical protein